MSGVWDNDEEGAFDEEGTLFDNKRMDDSVDEGADPTLAAEPVPSETAMAPAVAPREKVALVARYDARSQPQVARHAMRGGRPVQLEQWRVPTAEEHQKLVQRGKLVQGGVVSTSTNQQAAMQMSPLGEVEPSWKKYAKVGVGVAATGALLYGGYRVYQTLKEAKEAA